MQQFLITSVFIAVTQPECFLVIPAYKPDYLLIFAPQNDYHEKTC